MNRWTMKELSTLNNFDFAGAILMERRGSLLNPYTPLYQKLSESRVEILAAAERERMIFDCESSDCAYNHGGECRFARVHERRPEITMENGCAEYTVFGE